MENVTRKWSVQAWVEKCLMMNTKYIYFIYISKSYCQNLRIVLVQGLETSCFISRLTASEVKSLVPFPDFWRKTPPVSLASPEH